VFDLFRKWLNRDPTHRYRVVDDPSEAAFILYFELTPSQTLDYVEALLDEPLRRRFPNKLVTFNQHWTPAGFLPGLYTGMPHDRVDPDIHHPWGFIFLANGLVTRTSTDDIEPNSLYTFRGAKSHPVREAILALPVPPDTHARVQHIDRWFDHTDEEKASYVEELRDSKFVLCPRGVGPSSHRLFETMALGRCPVILSDDWAPVPGVDWDSCSIRMAESDVQELPRLLREREHDAARLGQNARRIWEQLFSPTNGPRAMLDVCHEMVRRRRVDWNSREFRRRWLEPDILGQLADVTESEVVQALGKMR
jgi:hypothetical protein